jgi:chromosome segregation ATPase
MSENTNDKFKVDIREAVADVMAAKEDAERISAIENLLEDSQKTITDLSEVVTSKELELSASAEEVTTLKTKVEELEAKAEEFQVILAEAKKGTDALEERASVAEGQLAAITADSALAGRMSELEVAKVALSGDKRVAQEERVRAMSDEEFTSYKEERAELRAQLEEELKEAAASKEGEGEPTAEEKAAAEAAAAAATLNVENASANVQTRYLDFANALAADMRGDKE